MTASPMLESTAESHRSFASARRRAAWSTSTSAVIIAPPATNKAIWRICQGGKWLPRLIRTIR